MNAVIIPALNPDERLVSLVNELYSLGQKYIVAVDDGSNAKYQTIFRRLEMLGCLVCHHVTNMGKGEAIKTGIRTISEKIPGISGYITADADGQHRAKDVLHISEVLDMHPESIILGMRDLTGKNVPRRSRFGNRFSALFFRLTTGVSCPDTQTGLRGFSARFTDLSLAVPGSRYEYEMNFLSAAAKMKIPFFMVPIETVYYGKNELSHFRPVADSLRVYKTPLKFAAASLSCAIVDLLIFTLITHIISTKVYALVFIATVTARILSGVLNFVLNRKWTFNNCQSWSPQAVRYLTLFLFQMMASWLLVWGFSFLAVSLTVIKVIVDCTLFVFSYVIQRHWVFAK
ncbi:MAG: bifunctional glycosyltransferase family 2/GtrA family protein [Chloroflexi bacterium]|nr:bifunctional glycosyltransferase family 2/GtrA family protein [Chloroflexota bacterium]